MLYKEKLSFAICMSLCLAAATLSGCKTWSKKPFDLKSGLSSLSPLSDDEADAAPVGRPFKMVAIWKDATLNTPAKAVRGFAGRVYFFDKEDNPIRVDGDVVVYGFDDTEQYDTKETADKKFVTKAEDLPAKHSVSKVGSSYSIWLPWDESGGFRKSITLVPMFKGRDGTVVRAEPTKNHLPGNKPESVVEQEKFLRQFRQSVRNGVAPASYETGGEIDEERDNVKRMKTTTIMIPQSMSDRLQVGEQLLKSGDVLPDGTIVQEMGGANQSQLSKRPSFDAAANRIAAEADVERSESVNNVARISTSFADSTSVESESAGGNPATRSRFKRIPIKPIGNSRR